LAQGTDELAVLGIRAGDGEARLEGEPGDGRHPRSADADHVHGGHGPVGGPLRLVDHVPGTQDGARHAGGGTVGAGAIGVVVDGSGGGVAVPDGAAVDLGGAGGGQARLAALVTLRAITSAASVMPNPREARDIRSSRGVSLIRGSTCSSR